MAKREELKHHSIFHEEIDTANSLSPKNGKTPITKTFRFLKPCTQQIDQAVPIPNTPLLSEIYPQNLTQWPSKVVFRGWLFPQKRWKEWFDRLCGKYSAVWNQAGIRNAILSSTYVVRHNQDLVLGVTEFWSPETNTFVFPWGEATVTLEDIMILGGYPVLGEGINTPLDEEMKKVVQGLEEHRIGMSRSKARKADHSTWITYFMDKESEFEHVAFLSLWLSRYVFPSHSLCIGNNFFPIAVKLSCGIKVALAPVVLASIYRNLKLLKEGALTAKETIQVWGPFQLLKLWVFEHFPILRPKSMNILKRGDPRVALWCKLSSKADTLPRARSALKVAENFEWRPYAANVTNWRHLSYYGEKKQTVMFNDSSLDSELCSFYKCLLTCEIVGLGSVEDYSPHRVAMQFGYDQDLPSDPTKFVLDSEKISFFVPPRSFRSCASDRYTKWFKDTMLTRELVVKHVLKREKYPKILKASSSIKDKSDSRNLYNFRSEKEMDEFLECSDDEEQFFNSKKSAITAGANTSNREDMSLNSSDDDNIPIGTLFNKNKCNDSKATTDSGPEFLCTLGTEIADGNSRKRENFNWPMGDEKLYIPSRVLESAVTFKNSKSVQENAVELNDRIFLGTVQSSLGKREAIVDESTSSKRQKVNKHVIPKYPPGFEPIKIQIELPNEPTEVSENPTVTRGEILAEHLAEGRAKSHKDKVKDEEKEARALRLNKLRNLPLETRVSILEKRFGLKSVEA